MGQLHEKMKYKKFDNHLPVHVGLKLVQVPQHGATDDFVTLVPGPMKAALLLPTSSMGADPGKNSAPSHPPVPDSAEPCAKYRMSSFLIFRGEK